MSSDYKWKVFFKPSGFKDLSRLPKTVQERIVQKVRFFALSDSLLKFIKKLEDNRYGDFRFRVGDYRVIFDKDDKRREVFILKIAKRDEVYK